MPLAVSKLKLDYEDFLRHRELPLWAEDDPRRVDLVRRRCATTDEVAAWVKEIYGRDGQNGPDGQRLRPAEPSMKSIESIQSTFPEIAANAALVLIGVACALLDRQIEAQARAFTEEGGFTERLHRIRSATRRRG